MPRVTESTAIAFAENVRESLEGEYTIENVVKEVLSHTPAYYASNPSEVEAWITEWMTREAEAADCEDHVKPRVPFNRFQKIAVEEQERALRESENQRGVR